MSKKELNLLKERIGHIAGQIIEQEAINHSVIEQINDHHEKEGTNMVATQNVNKPSTGLTR